jgi:hypothetical protein
MLTPLLPIRSMPHSLLSGLPRPVKHKHGLDASAEEMQHVVEEGARHVVHAACLVCGERRGSEFEQGEGGVNGDAQGACMGSKVLRGEEGEGGFGAGGEGVDFGP